MATPAERRAMVKKNPTAKIIWYALLVIQALEFIVALLAVFGVSLFGAAIAKDGGMLGVMMMTIGGLVVALGALIFFGLYNIERWIVWLLWLNLLGSLSALLAGKLTGIAALLTLIGYYYLLNLVKPSTTPTPAQ